MHEVKKTSIAVQGTAITVLMRTAGDYICLTDIARHKDHARS